MVDVISIRFYQNDLLSQTSEDPFFPVVKHQKNFPHYDIRVVTNIFSTNQVSPTGLIHTQSLQQPLSTFSSMLVNMVWIVLVDAGRKSDHIFDCRILYHVKIENVTQKLVYHFSYIFFYMKSKYFINFFYI